MFCISECSLHSQVIIETNLTTIQENMFYYNFSIWRLNYFNTYKFQIHWNKYFKIDITYKFAKTTQKIG